MKENLCERNYEFLYTIALPLCREQTAGLFQLNPIHATKTSRYERFLAHSCHFQGKTGLEVRPCLSGHLNVFNAYLV